MKKIFESRFVTGVRQSVWRPGDAFLEYPQLVCHSDYLDGTDYHCVLDYLADGVEGDEGCWGKRTECSGASFRGVVLQPDLVALKGARQ